MATQTVASERHRSSSGASDAGGKLTQSSSRKQSAGSAPGGGAVSETADVVFVIIVPSPDHVPTKIPKGHDEASIKRQRRSLIRTLQHRVRDVGLTISKLSHSAGSESELFGVGIAEPPPTKSKGGSERDSGAYICRIVHNRLTEIPGVLPGDRFLANALRLGKIQAVFPLHDKTALASLKATWTRPLASQPLSKIRSYFGDKIAMYFAFLGFYTTWLLVPALLGGALYFVQQQRGLVGWHTMAYGCFMVLWASLVIRFWQRRESELAFEWETLGGSWSAEASDMPYDERTKRYYDPTYWASIAPYLVTVPVTLLMLAVSVASMLTCDITYHYLDARLRFHPLLSSPETLPTEEFALERGFSPSDTFLWDKWPYEALLALKFSPSALYAVVIAVLDAAYSKLAVKLTDFEGHKGKSRQASSRVLKLVCFQFINNYISLFYLAFVVQDLAALRSRLAVLLIVKQLMQQVQEIIVPMFKSKYRQRRRHKHIRDAMEKEKETDDDDSGHDATNSTVSGQTEITDVEGEVDMEKYPDTYEDLLEMWVQFGHITLFASVFPLAAGCALINNMIEIRTDAWKLCDSQRPVPGRTASLGPWIAAFEFLAVSALISNLGLISVSSNLMERYMPETEPLARFGAIISMEHIVLVAMMSLRWVIHPIPSNVRVMIANRILAGHRGEEISTEYTPLPNLSATAQSLRAMGLAAAFGRSRGTADVGVDATHGPEQRIAIDRGGDEASRHADDALGDSPPNRLEVDTSSPGSVGRWILKPASPTHSEMTATSLLSSSAMTTDSVLLGDGAVVAAVAAKLHELIIEKPVKPMPSYRTLRKGVEAQLQRRLPRDRRWKAWFRATVDTQIATIVSEHKAATASVKSS